jgi:hypothetical protein
VRFVIDEGEAERSRSRYAGYVPFMGIGVGAGAGGWLASLLGLPEWFLALPGIVAGYFLAGAVLRRIYADDE